MQGSNGLPPGGIRISQPQHTRQTNTEGAAPAAQHLGYFQNQQQQLFMNFSQHQQVAHLAEETKTAIFHDFCAFMYDPRISQRLGGLDLYSQIQYHIQFSSFIQQNARLQQPDVDQVYAWLHHINTQHEQQGNPNTRSARNRAELLFRKRPREVAEGRDFDSARITTANQRTFLDNQGSIAAYMRSQKSIEDVMKITTSLLKKKFCSPEDAYRLMRNLQQAEIPLDTITYSAAITVCANAIKHATTRAESSQIFTQFNALLTGMQKAKIPLDTITYNAAITVCANAIKHATTQAESSQIFTQFNALLTGMQQAKIPLDTITYSAAITVCANAINKVDVSQIKQAYSNLEPNVQSSSDMRLKTMAGKLKKSIEDGMVDDDSEFKQLLTEINATVWECGINFVAL